LVKGLALMLLATAAVPVAAQDFSAGYNFLKAVKDRDPTTVNRLVATPGSVVINSKEQPSGNGALHLVARDRDLNWLGFLLSKGAKADLQNAEGNTPLAVAAQLGWLEGAEILVRRSPVDLANRRGETPLMLAVQKRDLAMVRLLIARGADPARTDSVAGLSALDYARRDGRAAAIVKLLEAPRAKPNAMQGPTL
jgi:ankyrin repeat protein